ncbi:hypothetical protein ACWEGQ_10985, partial [Streptomyces seoulensis]
MDSTRVTEQPTSFERPQPGVDPADARGALPRTPQPPQALPLQPCPDGAPRSAAPGAAGEPARGAGANAPFRFSFFWP